MPLFGCSVEENQQREIKIITIYFTRIECKYWNHLVVNSFIGLQTVPLRRKAQKAIRKSRSTHRVVLSILLWAIATQVVHESSTQDGGSREPQSCTWRLLQANPEQLWRCWKTSRSKKAAPAWSIFASQSTINYLKNVLGGFSSLSATTLHLAPVEMQITLREWSTVLTQLCLLD